MPWCQIPCRQFETFKHSVRFWDQVWALRPGNARKWAFNVPPCYGHRGRFLIYKKPTPTYACVQQHRKKNQRMFRQTSCQKNSDILTQQFFFFSRCVGVRPEEKSQTSQPPSSIQTVALAWQLNSGCSFRFLEQYFFREQYIRGINLKDTSHRKVAALPTMRHVSYAALEHGNFICITI